MWTRSSNWFIAIWRKTVAIWPSTASASSAEPRRRVVGVVEQAAEDDLLGEHRGRLGDGQRRVLVEDALLAGERLVQAVAELVGEGEHVAAAVGVVEHHVGVDRGHGRGAEGAAALDGRRRRVDPALVEEALDDLGGLVRRTRRTSRATSSRPCSQGISTSSSETAAIRS